MQPVAPPGHGADPLELENWYQRLKEHTFATAFVPIEEAEARALLDVYTGKPGAAAALETLERRLGRHIGDDGAFVRLSTRSPKDYALRATRTTALFQHEQRCLRDDPVLRHESDDTRDVIAIVRAMSRALRVRNASEALDMIGHSERSYQDLTRRTLNWEPINIVVRQWCTRLQPECELRAFVHRKRLTCVSQYYKACYAPQLWARRDAVAAASKRVVAAAQPLLDLESYVIDLAYVCEDDVCLIVELNHWHHTTSSAMFDWKADIELLENGPFTLRLQPCPVPNVRALIAKPLRAMAGWTDVHVDTRPVAAAGQGASVYAPVAPRNRRATSTIKQAARAWQLADPSSASAAVRGQLLSAATRRLPSPFWTHADVGHIAPDLHIRAPVDEPISPASCVVPTLYCVLWLRIAGRGDSNELASLLRHCESVVAAHCHDLDTDVHNALLAMRELGLIKRFA